MSAKAQFDADPDKPVAMHTGDVEWEATGLPGAPQKFLESVGYPEKRIPSHDHAMGEETLVVDGELKDEFGVYGPGTWFRFPIGVAHAPYTEDKPCFMLIREGDLVW